MCIGAYMHMLLRYARMHFKLSLSHNLVKMPVSNKRRRQLSLARKLWQRKRKLMADQIHGIHVQIKGIDAEVS